MPSSLSSAHNFTFSSFLKRSSGGGSQHPTTPLVSQEATEGNSVVLHCELNKHAPSVEWRREGETLKNGDKYQIRKKDLQAEMKITDLTMEDTGDYSCVCGEERTTARIEVNGQFLPFFGSHTSKVQTHEAQAPTSVTGTAIFRSLSVKCFNHIPREEALGKAIAGTTSLDCPESFLGFLCWNWRMFFSEDGGLCLNVCS
uniref:Ig-like domain-containing protein n=1 Tax=Oryzias latipes TaxID=8090 RepID=A0A3B3INP9_ORYLA